VQAKATTTTMTTTMVTKRKTPKYHTSKKRKFIDAHFRKQTATTKAGSNVLKQ